MDEMFDVFEGKGDNKSASEDESEPQKSRSRDQTLKRKADEAMNGNARSWWRSLQSVARSEPLASLRL